MKIIFNKIFILKELPIFYGYIGFMVFCIILALIFVIKEIRKPNANK